MIITGDRQYAPVAGGAKGVGMLDDIHTAINARAFAVPHAENTVITGAFKQVGLLATPDRRRCEILINARLEHHIMLVQPGTGLP